MAGRLTPDHSASEPTARPLNPLGSLPARWTLAPFVSVLVLLVPVVAYFWLIHRYGLNVIFYDQWNDVPLISHPTLGALWAQHNENRILFPNLVVLALARTTHFNIVDEELLSAVMLVAATALIILAHHRRSRATPWLAYVLLVVLLLSFVQDGDTLWGFQLAWYMVMLTLACCVFLLDRPVLTRVVYAAAVSSAVIGSFSSLQGLLIWPVGLLLLWQRRRSRAFLLAWVLSAFATTVIYLYGLNFSKANPNGTFVLTHLPSAARFFFTAIGNIFGGQIINIYGTRVPHSPDIGSGSTIALGVMVFLIAAWVLAVYGTRRDERTASPVGVALVCFGLLFAMSLTAQRTASPGSASLSRYTTFDLLILAGGYLALLGKPPSNPRIGAWHPNHLWLPIARWILVVLIALQVVLGTAEGLVYARSWERQEIVVADITVNMQKAPNALIGAEVVPDPVSLSASFLALLRHWAQLARRQRLSLFATDALPLYQETGILIRVSTQIVTPSNSA